MYNMVHTLVDSALSAMGRESSDISHLTHHKCHIVKNVWLSVWREIGLGIMSLLQEHDMSLEKTQYAETFLG